MAASAMIRVARLCTEPRLIAEAEARVRPLATGSVEVRRRWATSIHERVPRGAVPRMEQHKGVEWPHPHAKAARAM
jgi:hypothetical protein